MTKMLTISLLALLAGCDPLTHEMQPGVAEESVKRLSYAKDAYGICYAMTSSQTSHGLSVLSIASVPCDKVNQ